MTHRRVAIEDRAAETDPRVMGVEVASSAAAYASILLDSSHVPAPQNSDPTPGDYLKVTQFQANGPSQEMTPEHTNDRIVVDESGAYLVTWSCSFVGAGSTVFTMQLRVNDSPTAQPIEAQRNTSAGSGVGSFSLSGCVALTAGQNISVWFTGSVGGRSFDCRTMQLLAVKV